MAIITSESRLALAGVAVMPIHAGAAILARTGLAFVFFLLTVLSHPASLTLTNVASHKNTGTGLKCGISCRAIKSPASVASERREQLERLSEFNAPILLFNTFSVHARLRSAVVGPREAQGSVGAGGAYAVEPVDVVHTGSPAHTRV